ncbi:MAG: FAD-dependent thymidylate synthase [Nitrosopumilaceae archaeon]|nr:FAD-dependent thymidylate synthase [Nitrosopumilaceae archaeon]
MAEFTGEEARRLEGHFSNTGANIFVLITPDQVDRGALMSRYSRSSKSMRRVFLDEFLNNPDRGKKFYERVLMEYGDDSVAELGMAQVAMEGLSNIAAQKIEDRRIGLSFLEKSSRYVSWDAKSGGRYAYYRGPDIMESRHEKIYEEACDLSFDTYTYSLPLVKAHLMDAYPIDDFLFRDSGDFADKPFSELTVEVDIKSAERAYRNATNSMALDLLRGLLPASTLTNLGVAGNGRAFEYLISTLKSSKLHEERSLGDRLASELKSTMGPFIRRASEKHGKLLEEYLTELRGASGGLRFDIAPATENRVRLVSYDAQQDALDTVVAGLLYENSGNTFEDLHRIVSERMSDQQKHDIVRTFAGLRKSRRQRPPRAFELVSYVFDMVNNFGMFRDMHRHRILTLQRQLLDAKHGFDVPPELEDTGCSREFAECMKRSGEAYEQMAKTDTARAQYVVNFAYRYQYMMRVNLRELCHLVELRTLPQGHQDYRDTARRMYEQVCDIHPTLSQIMKFVDTKIYRMGRIGPEKRTMSKILEAGGSTGAAGTGAKKERNLPDAA